MRWCWLGRFYPTHYFWIFDLLLFFLFLVVSIFFGFLTLSFFGSLVLSFFWIFGFIIFFNFWFHHFLCILIGEKESSKKLGNRRPHGWKTLTVWPLLHLRAMDTIGLLWHLTAPRPRLLPLASNVYSAGCGWKEWSMSYSKMSAEDLKPIPLPVQGWFLLCLSIFPVFFLLLDSFFTAFFSILFLFLHMDSFFAVFFFPWVFWQVVSPRLSARPMDTRSFTDRDTLLFDTLPTFLGVLVWP